jgi:aminopeptidase N
MLRPRSGVSLLLLASLLPAQSPRNVSGGPLIPEQGCFDVQHYDLVLTVDPVAKVITGKLTMQARITATTQRIVLDLDGALHADEVTVGTDKVKAVHKDGRIGIDLPAELQPGSDLVVSVQYGGAPRVAPNPPWNGGFTWAKTVDGKPWIATTCQGEGADLWWPCKDHPSDKPEHMDLHITVPEGLIVASNGTLQKDEKGKQGHTWHWHIASPISNYCVALNIAPYEVITDSYQSLGGEKVPVQFYVLPEHEAQGRKFLPEFLDHLKCFEEILGPYPFRKEKYGIAETPHKGMEHQTIIAYGNKFVRLQFNYDWLHCHELAHEWWGNLVTCRDWKDMWIHEGFGSYMQALYLERRRSPEAYRIEMRNQAKFVNRIAVAPREGMNSQQVYFDNGGSNDIYFKGSWVVHTLRWQLGDEKFFQCLRRFCYPTVASEKVTDGSQVRLVDTDEFVRLCSRIAGSDLAWFFEVYVRQPKLPVLEQELKAGVLELRWVVPDGMVFTVPVPVQVGDKVERVAMPGGKGTLKVGTRKFEIDPDWRLLMAR